MINDKWQMINDKWQMINDKWQMTNDKWQMTNEKWQNGKKCQVRQDGKEEEWQKWHDGKNDHNRNANIAKRMPKTMQGSFTVSVLPKHFEMCFKWNHYLSIGNMKPGPVL